MDQNHDPASIPDQRGDSGEAPIPVLDQVPVSGGATDAEIVVPVRPQWCGGDGVEHPIEFFGGQP